MASGNGPEIMHQSIYGIHNINEWEACDFVYIMPYNSIFQVDPIIGHLLLALISIGNYWFSPQCAQLGHIKILLSAIC